ncbi:MAG: MFS transporter [Syntrophobacterales bacterium]|nr:MFS transporter [Syntrophobacterales bacterium]
MTNSSGSRHYLLIIACFVTLGFYVASYMRIPIVPIYAKLMGASTKMVGVINSAFFFTAGLLSFPMGFLSDRVGRKVVTSMGLLLVSFTSFALYLAPSPLYLVFIYFLFGVGLSAYGPTMMSLVADITPPTHIGRAYGWYTTSLYLGMSGGPAIGSWIAEKFGYGVVFASSGLLTIVLLFVMLLTIPSRTQLRILEGRSHPKIDSIKDTKLLNEALVASWIITWGGCFSLGMFVTFVPLHAHDSGISLSNIGSIFLLQGLTNALCRAPFGWLSDRIGSRSRFAVGGITLTTLAMVGLAVSHKLYQFLLYAVLLGSGMAIAFPSISAIITDVTSPSTRGIAMGGYNSAIYFGIMSASLIMGPIVEKWGYKVAFEASSLMTISAIFVFISMIRHYYRKH